MHKVGIFVLTGNGNHSTSVKIRARDTDRSDLFMGTGRPIAIIYLSTPRMPDVIFQFGIIDDRMKVTKSGKGTALNDTKKRIRQQQNKTHTHKKKYFDIVFFLFPPRLSQMGR